MNTHSTIHEFLSIQQPIHMEHLTSTLVPLTYYHYHDGCEIYLFLHGNSKMYVESQAFPLKRGDLFVLRPNELHRAFCLDKSSYERCTIYLLPEYLKSISSPQTDLFRFYTTSSNTDHMRHLSEQELQQFLLHFQKVNQCLHSSSYGDDLLANAELIQLLVMVNLIFEKREMHTKNHMPDLIQDIMDYIETHLTEPISLQNLSQALFHNGAYLSRKFKEHTGISLRDYILCKRILLAKNLLSQGLPLTTVCQESGFHDYANFNRTFTKHTGYSPGKYQKQMIDVSQ